tara:strand:- start:1002 stop:1421 length:420 start_codon:yes stop_codon:yes gene_type:complete
MTVLGFIKINKKTQGHADVLTKLGYTVNSDVQPEHLVVECTGFVVQEIDLTDHAAALDSIKGWIKEKKLISYKSSFKAKKKDGNITVLPGVHGARYLNQVVPGMSALVAKEDEPAVLAQASFSMDDLIDAEVEDDSDSE